MNHSNVKAAMFRGAGRPDSLRSSIEKVSGGGPPRQRVSKGHGEAPLPIDAREKLKGRLALPVPEVAGLLGISTAAVRLMIARGDLPGRKIGGGTERVTYIVPTSALLAWLDGAARAAAEGAA